MTKQKIRKICEDIQKNYIDRMSNFCEDNRTEDAKALYEEIKEWLVEKEKPTILAIKNLKKNLNQIN
jgi:hypothetical protein